MRRSIGLGLCIALSGLLHDTWAQTCTLDRATGTTIDAQPWLKNGYGNRWNHATNLVAFMQPDATGY